MKAVAAGVFEVVFIVGHLRDAVRAHLAERYPRITAHYAVQEVQDGTAGAVALPVRGWRVDTRAAPSCGDSTAR